MPVSSAVNKKMTNYLRKRAECVLYIVYLIERENEFKECICIFKHVPTFFISHLILFIDISTSGERLITKNAKITFG